MSDSRFLTHCTIRTIIVPFIALVLPEENLSIVIRRARCHRLRVDLGLTSSCFILKLNSGLIGNLAQAEVLIYLVTSPEMVRKKGPSRSGKSQKIYVFSEKLGKILMNELKQDMDTEQEISTITKFMFSHCTFPSAYR